MPLPLILSCLTIAMLLVLVLWGWRTWKRGKANQAEAQKFREAEAAQKRRQERREKRKAESAITPVDPDENRHQGRRSVVLVVDDSDIIRHSLRRTLENHGYRVITAENGRQAWEEVLQEAKARPDLIITDIQMPKVNGFQLLRMVRADLDLTNVPVLLLTGHEEYSVPQGHEEGANGFLRKPYTDDDLLEQVRYALQD